MKDNARATAATTRTATAPGGQSEPRDCTFPSLWVDLAIESSALDAGRLRAVGAGTHGPNSPSGEYFRYGNTNKEPVKR